MPRTDTFSELVARSPRAQRARAHYHPAILALSFASLGVGLSVAWWAGLALWLGGAVILTAVLLLVVPPYREALRTHLEGARDAGSGRRLRGEVGLLVVRLVPPGTGPGALRASTGARHELSRALAWLAQRAGARGVELSVRELAWIRLEGTLRPDPRGAVRGHVIETLRQEIRRHPELGRPDVPEEVVALVITSERIRPFASAAARGEERTFELAFARCDSDARTFAHELLHLFGARDLYLDASSDAAARARRELELDLVADACGSFAGSVMAGDAKLEDAHVDPATAFAIGWSDELPRRRRAATGARSGAASAGARSE